MTTGIVVALPEELRTLSKLPGYSLGQKIVKGSYAFVGQKIVVACSGAGPQNAHSAAELLVAEGGVTRLISWGCAAALNETLTPGDLILADEVIDANNQIIVIQSEWRNHAEHYLSQHTKVHKGRLVESEKIVSSSENKKLIQASTNGVILDMESVAVARVARHHNLPFLAIRAIADPVSMDLPKAIEFALNDAGEVIMGKLLRHLACHPAELPELVKMGIYFSAAKKTLELVARHLPSVLKFDDTSNQ
ncbi:MAG: phosphorylase [Methylococcaceae bacterium]|nr:phosphorylase [Methylococcaceae bacterium]